MRLVGQQEAYLNAGSGAAAAQWGKGLLRQHIAEFHQPCACLPPMETMAFNEGLTFFRATSSASSVSSRQSSILGLKSAAAGGRASQRSAGSVGGGRPCKA